MLSASPYPGTVDARDAVADAIRDHGPITFAEFMEIALYGPGGYYERPPVGADGDFVTSPHVHEVFAELLAGALEDLHARLGAPRPFRVTELGAGDILLYWTPGPTPDDDALTCHRMVGRVPAMRGEGPKFLMKGDALSRIDSFENGRQSEILGKVAAISRDGKTWPVPGRIGNLARLFGSLVAIPILRMAGR